MAATPFDIRSALRVNPVTGCRQIGWQVYCNGAPVSEPYFGWQCHENAEAFLAGCLVMWFFAQRQRAAEREMVAA